MYLKVFNLFHFVMFIALIWICGFGISKKLSANDLSKKTSNAIDLKSASGTVTDADGNVYHTIRIGDQVWTIENLRTTKYNDGTTIQNVTDSKAWVKLTTGAYCYYKNETVNREKYGALYNWYTVKTGKLAPQGWHVPTDAEWTELEKYLTANGFNWDGSKTDCKIGKSLAAKTDWSLNSDIGTIGNDLSKNNSSGFSALPGGYRSHYGDFLYQTELGYWWSASESNANNAYYRYLYAECIYSFDFSKTIGFSVRLVMD